MTPQMMWLYARICSFPSVERHLGCVFPTQVQLQHRRLVNRLLLNWNADKYLPMNRRLL